MIIRLTGADFSANNLGKVDLRTELSSFTKAAIAASGNTSMTENQQWGLETFFEKIGAVTNDGIFSKLQFLCIPYIASGLEKSLVDYKDNSVMGVPDSASYAMVEHGIKSITSGDTKPINIDGKYNFTHNSYSILFTITSVSNYDNSSRTKLLTVGTSSDERYDLKVTSTSGGTLAIANVEGTGASNIFTFCEDFEKVSNTGAFVVKNGVANVYPADRPYTYDKVLNTVATVNNSNKLSLFSSIGRTGNNSNSFPVGLLAAGEYLTDEEVKVFIAAANKLKDLFI